MQPTEKKLLPVYASWKTVQNSIDALSKANLPNVIDRTVFPGLNWGVQGHLLSGLRFLGLTDDNGTPSEDLKILVHDPSKRKEIWKRILQAKYAPLIALDLARAMPNELLDKLRELGLTGETVDKALRFFISAATFAELPLSAHLGGKKTKYAARRKPTRRAKAQSEHTVAPVAAAPTVAGGTSCSIVLQSGGVLTLSASIDLFALSGDDRKFVFDLIDRIQSYQQNGTAAE